MARIFSKHGELFGRIRESAVEIWEVPTNKRLYLYEGSSAPTALDFSRGQKLLFVAIGLSNGEIVVLNAKTKALCAILKHGRCISSIRFGKDGALYSASDDNRIVKWNIEIKKEITFWKTTKSLTKTANTYMLQITDKYLCAAINSSIKVYDLLKPQCVKIIKGHTTRIECMESFQNALVTASESYVNVWNLQVESKAILAPVFRANTNIRIESLQVHSIKKKSGTCLVIAGGKAQVFVYKVRMQKQEHQTLNCSNTIEDSAGAIIALLAHKKADIILAFEKPRGCVFSVHDIKTVKNAKIDSNKFTTKLELAQKQSSYSEQFSQAKVISLLDHSITKATVVSTVYEGKLLEGVKKPEKVMPKSKAAIESALVQALRSGDKDNIDWVLKHKDVDIIENTVKTLSTEISLELLKAILTKLEEKKQEIGFTSALFSWLHILFKHKAVGLLQERSLLVPLSKSLEERTLHFQKLLLLKGKLDFLLQLCGESKEHTLPPPKYEAVRIFDENDSDEEVEGVEVLDVKQLHERKDLENEDISQEEASMVEEVPDVVEVEDEESQGKILSESESENMKE